MVHGYCCENILGVSDSIEWLEMNDVMPVKTGIQDVGSRFRDIQWIEDWMNNYPRKILGYKIANQVAEECLQSDNFWKRSKVVAL